MEVRVAIAQINTVTGDLKGNSQRIVKAIERAHQEGADVVVFPAKALTGHCAGVLFEQQYFIADQQRYLYEDIATRVPADLTAVIGFVGFVDLEPEAAKAKADGQRHLPVGHLPVPSMTDLMAIIQDGRVASVCENRSGGAQICEINVRGHNVRLALILNQERFAYGQLPERRERCATLACENGTPLVFVNTVGIGDTMKEFHIFDGGSMAICQNGKLLSTLARFAEDFSIVKFDLDNPVATACDRAMAAHNTAPATPAPATPAPATPAPAPAAATPEKYEEIYEALKFAAREVFRLSGLKKAQVHISGGVDSAVVGALAVDAFGPENTVFITNPTVDSSEPLKNIAQEIARNLGMPLRSNPTGPIYDETVRQHIAAFGVEPTPAGRASIQAVTRTVQGLAASHTFKTGILAAGNHTEIALGWASFHDIGSSGVMSLIGDLSKREVFALADYINRRFTSASGRHEKPNKPIPRILFDQDEAQFIKPAAELADSKVDPIDYDIMSGVCALLAREHLGPEEIIRQFNERSLDMELFPKTIYQKEDVFADEVWKAFSMSQRATYKAGQAAPTPLVAPRRPGVYSHTLGTIINRYLGRYEPLA